VLGLFEEFVEWVQREPLASSIAIIAIYILLVLFTFPVLYLTIAIGYSYSKVFSPQGSLHTFSATLVAFTAALALITFAVTLGALFAFLISRHWLSRTFKKRFLKHHRTFVAIDSVISESGWRTVLLLRLTPLPFSLVSYLLGVTKVTVRDYIVGSLGEAVDVALGLYIGQSLERFSDLSAKANDNQIEYIMIAF